MLLGFKKLKMISFEEKLIRYIASKLIQKKFFLEKHRYPSDKELVNNINKLLHALKNKYKQLSLVRRHSELGILTPIIQEIIQSFKI